jgi:hypothetical protein
MDVLLRTVAIIVEVVILAAIVYAMLKGARLTLFDLGVGQKYSRVITMVLFVVGTILVIFFIAHLTTFYPAV